jgi:hypothetical protein
MRPRSRAALAAAALLTGPLLAAPAAAQPVAVRPAAPAGAPRPIVAQTAAVNLLALPFGVVAAEYERAVGHGLAVAVGGRAGFGNTTTDDRTSDARLASAQVKLKYYPREEGLRGFAVGVTAGVAYGSRADRSASDAAAGASVSGAGARRSVTAPTLGAALDYNFLVGRQRRLLVGVGVGARHALGVRRGDPLAAATPTSRLQLGFGF